MKTWDLLKVKWIIFINNKPIIAMLLLNIIIILIIKMMLIQEIYAVKKVYETIYDEMNDPNQGFNDDNVYRKLSGGWAIDHPDGSTTIIVRGEPLQNPPREWLVKGADGEWYDSNDFAEVEEIKNTTVISEHQNKTTDSIIEVSEVENNFHYEILEELCKKIKYCKDPKEVYRESMQFVINRVPENIWSKHKDEINDEQSIVNRYLTEFSHNLHNGDETITYTFFEAAIVTYNTAQLLDVVDKEELLFKVFQQTVRKHN